MAAVRDSIRGPVLMLEILRIWDWRKWDFAGKQKLAWEGVFFFTSKMVKKKLKCHFGQYNQKKKQKNTTHAITTTVTTK